MAINLNDNLSIAAPKASDSRYGPYLDIPSALSSVSQEIRYRGLTLGVISEDSVKEYWFKDGLTDIDLIEKSPEISSIQGIQGLQGFSGIQGLTGIQGPAGLEPEGGAQGIQGLQGIQGPAGGGSGGGGDITVSTVTTTTTHTVTPTSLTEVNPTAVTNFTGSQDEGFVSVPIGFNIQIFGNTYSSFTIGSNSYFTFGGYVQEYGGGGYDSWIGYVPYPGVFIGSDDGSYQKVTSTGPLGTVGQRTNTFRFLGSFDYSNSDPALSDIIWEVTFKEDEPAKIFLNIISFDDNGYTEGIDFFTFSSNGQQGEYIQFSPVTGSQYVITMETAAVAADFTGSKIVILDKVLDIEENPSLDSIDIEFGYVQSDSSLNTSFGRIKNIVSLSQVDFDSLALKDPETLYVVVN